jgi:uncharacterized protein YqeY
MALKQRLMDDLKEAMKAKDKLRKSVITMVRADIKQHEIDNRVELDDDKIIDILSKQVKQKKDAIEEFHKGNREDLVNQAKDEIEILMEYLPQQLEEEEITKIVEEVIAKVGATSLKDMGKIMAKLMPEVKGRADGKVVNKIVRQFLQ